MFDDVTPEDIIKDDHPEELNQAARLLRDAGYDFIITIAKPPDCLYDDNGIPEDETVVVHCTMYTDSIVKLGGSPLFILKHLRDGAVRVMKLFQRAVLQDREWDDVCQEASSEIEVVRWDEEFTEDEKES
jgi:hypothetical protein